VADLRIIPRLGRDILGEGPLWSARRNALFWVDIKGRLIHRFSLKDESVTSWPAPEMIGWLIERKTKDGFVVGLQSGFAVTGSDFSAFEMIARLPDARPDVRLNDAKADAGGGVYAGSMELSGRDSLGGLYRLDPDHSVTRLDSGYGVANGPALSLDGRTLYHTDSPRRRIYAFTRDGDGALSDKRVFREFEAGDGSPDGMTVDAEDCLWVAHWDGGRLSRFAPDGPLISTHPLPASRITNCAFAGEGLDRLFVTSASEGREDEPFSGALFELDVGVKGAPPHLFAG
jgi:D-xylonolactonase